MFLLELGEKIHRSKPPQLHIQTFKIHMIKQHNRLMTLSGGTLESIDFAVHVTLLANKISHFPLNIFRNTRLNNNTQLYQVSAKTF